MSRADHVQECRESTALVSQRCPLHPTAYAVGSDRFPPHPSLFLSHPNHTPNLASTAQPISLPPAPSSVGLCLRAGPPSKRPHLLCPRSRNNNAIVSRHRSVCTGCTSAYRSRAPLLTRLTNRTDRARAYKLPILPVTAFTQPLTFQLSSSSHPTTPAPTPCSEDSRAWPSTSSPSARCWRASSARRDIRESCGDP